MAVTIKDIAKAANVSFSTVSSVLRSPGFAGRASPKTREKILECARKMNYQPSNTARALRTGKSRLVAFLRQSLDDMIVMEAIIGAEEILHRNDYNMLLGTFNGFVDCNEMLQGLIRKGVDGIVLASNPVGKCKKLFDSVAIKVPVVNLFSSSLSNSRSVFVDGGLIGQLGAEYLLNKGHRKILLLGNRPKTYDKFSAVINSAGFSGIEIVHWPEFSHFKDGENVIRRFIDNKLKVTSIFAYNDKNAAGIIQAAIHSGIKIPQDISVLGVNNSPFCEMLTPSLTTVAQPQKEQGMSAASLLLEIINQVGGTEDVVLEPYIVERESCGSIK